MVAEKTGREVRITILGHIQRGGHASAYDRILGNRLGVAAVDVCFHIISKMFLFNENLV